jgi:hypothetical protein
LVLPSIVAGCICLAACGGEPLEQPPSVGASSDPRLSSSIGSLTCTDWNKADLDTQVAIVEEIGAFAGGPVTGRGVSGTGNALEPDQARALFENRCSENVAESFLLYKLYTHAALFAGAE